MVHNMFCTIVIIHWKNCKYLIVTVVSMTENPRKKPISLKNTSTFQTTTVGIIISILFLFEAGSLATAMHIRYSNIVMIVTLLKQKHKIDNVSTV